MWYHLWSGEKASPGRCNPQTKGKLCLCTCQAAQNRSKAAPSLKHRSGGPSISCLHSLGLSTPIFQEGRFRIHFFTFLHWPIKRDDSIHHYSHILQWIFPGNPCFHENTMALLSINFPWSPVLSRYILSSIFIKCKANVKILFWCLIFPRTNVISPRGV